MVIKNLLHKAEIAIPDDETISKVADKLQQHTSPNAANKVDKAAQWAKDNNQD